MAADEEKKKKKGKRKGLGGLSPEKKKKLKVLSFFQWPTSDIFLICPQNIDCGYTL